MCGIFGLILGENSNFDLRKTKPTLDHLFKLSESRGKEASGITLLINNSIYVYKSPKTASDLIQTKDYNNLLKKTENNSLPTSLAIMGHARLVTNGTMAFNQNNQPVVKDGLIAIHNGIITNDQYLWGKYPSLKRKYEVDTEILLSLIRFFYSKNNNLIEAVRKTYKNLEGSASIGVMFKDLETLLLATNTGSLYFCQSKKNQISLFASELFIIKKTIQKNLSSYLDEKKIRQIKAGSGLTINLNNNSTADFLLRNNSKITQTKEKTSKNFKIINLSPAKKQIINNHQSHNSETYKPIMDEYLKNKGKIGKLKRCSKCILPETMPFIEFDHDGVCNYCRTYKRIEVKGQDSLEKIIAPYRSKNNNPDCIVAFSGGRDSSFGLHYIKNVLKMNPVAFSYDWGMLTDLARRNQARMCGKLGIEHILISANIAQKRDFIKKNVSAWLKKPDLGTIPLFMAGDKQYFYYANKLMNQMNIKLLIMAENPLERTHFKHGFCGITHCDSDKPPYFLNFKDKISMAFYYAKQFAKNPSYLNQSLFDTFTAYLSYYMIPHNYFYLFQYTKWDEETINKTLINKYHWELAKDTHSTWRIGDGTASFYNYIYYTVAGFTENDTFCSNQIREGVLKRNEAIIKASENNQPRLESIKWYCSTIGIDFEKTIKTINAIPKLYHFLAK